MILSILFDYKKIKWLLLGLTALCGSVGLASAQDQSSKVFLQASYTAQPWYAASGGQEQGFVYIDNLSLLAQVSIDQWLDFKNPLTLSINSLGNHGDKASALMGDYQVASNIEAPKAWRFYEFWVEQLFLKQRLSLLVGVMDINTEMDVLNPGLLFLNSSFGMGGEFAPTGLNGASTFPITSFGARLAYAVSDRLQFKVGVVDGVPGDPADPRSNEISLSKDEGALVTFESSIFYSQTPELRAGRSNDNPALDMLNIGLWYYTARFDEYVTEESSNGNVGGYIGLQKYFNQDTEKKNTSAFIRYGMANDQFNRMGSALSGGLVFSNWFFHESGEQFGLAFSTAFNGNAYLDVYPDQEDAETVIEMTYRVNPKPWLLIQPDLQYIINPGTNATLSNALGVALMIQLTFDRSF